MSMHRPTAPVSATLSLLLAVLGVTGCQSAPAPETAGDGASTTGAEEVTLTGPAVVGEEVTYSSGGVTLKGYLAYDANQTQPRPGVIVVHEWWGHNDYVRMRARMLAEMGYTALAIDMYGAGQNTQHPAEAKAFMQAALADKEAAAARFQAGQALLNGHPRVAAGKVAAIGYCFGGGVVLNMALAGAPLTAVASFHGALPAPDAVPTEGVQVPLLIMTGDSDPFAPNEAVKAFETALQTAGADAEVVWYAGAKHAFTNPAATALGATHGLPLAYDEAADKASWDALDAFLRRHFK